ncbi:MAG TPA: hypothetical protein VE420_01140, partial [Gemmatimonadales bacterium]|nr:hypothetical protein [Gemmatimonadales bacterium]
ERGTPAASGRAHHRGRAAPLMTPELLLRASPIVTGDGVIAGSLVHADNKDHRCRGRRLDRRHSAGR